MAIIDDLRRAANEPEGDSTYSDAQLEEILATAGGDVPGAAAAVWREKAAKFAELVDMREGETARDLSDMHGAALKMADMWDEQSATPPVTGRVTTIGRITRA
jgi:hypothetical protein